MKLEATGPEEKDKEWDALHLEHVAYTPAPPGPKREGTDPSAHTRTPDGGREDSPPKATWSRAASLPVQSGIKGETVKRALDHGGKGGHVIRDSCGDGSGCVAEEQNDLLEGFFFSRQGTPLIARAQRLEKLGGRRRAHPNEQRVRCSRASPRGGSRAPRRSSEEGWKRGNQ